MSISTCDPICRTSISSATTPMSLSGTATATGRAWLPNICWTTDSSRYAPRACCRDSALSTPRIWRASRCCARTTSPGSRGSRRPASIGRSHRGDRSSTIHRTCCRRRPKGRGSRSPAIHCSATTFATASWCGSSTSWRRRSRRFWLVYPPRMAGTAKLALFRRWLQGEIAADRSAPPQASPRKRRGRASAAPSPRSQGP